MIPSPRHGPSRAWLPAILLTLLVVGAATASAAKVSNENREQLPPGCDAIAGEASAIVDAGRAYAEPFPGAVFSFSNRSFEWPACTRVTITLQNHDHIRHQFMVHDAFPEGFFQLEADSLDNVTGTFITGAFAKTMLAHCGIPQHQQMGMKAQVLVAGGIGTLPNILGISGLPAVDRGEVASPPTTNGPPQEQAAAPGLSVLTLLGGVAVLALLRHRMHG